jgi:hypothetical protein
MSTQIGVHTESDWDIQIKIHSNAGGAKWIDIKIGRPFPSILPDRKDINAEVEMTVFCQSVDHLKRLVALMQSSVGEMVA